MIDKPLIIILFMYSMSFSILAGQYLVGDVFGVTLKNYNGTEIRNGLADALNTATLNSTTANVLHKDYTVIDVAGAFVKAAEVLTQFLLLLTGTYVFFILYQLGVPQIILYGMVVLYSIMLINTIIAKIRGV